MLVLENNSLTGTCQIVGPVYLNLYRVFGKNRTAVLPEIGILKVVSYSFHGSGTLENFYRKYI